MLEPSPTPETFLPRLTSLTVTAALLFYLLAPPDLDFFAPARSAPTTRSPSPWLPALRAITFSAPASTTLCTRGEYDHDGEGGYTLSAYCHAAQMKRLRVCVAARLPAPSVQMGSRD
ncbi:hypothetical protein C8R45DRAFT_1112291 [Mycena sanguinolenta]|nr:hypothetical protein C8R45DRAFT_1112291 [Mycena sanguinolenta]